MSELERYEIVNLIGKGGGGSVYLARDLHLGRMVALKRILLQNQEQFLQEVHLLQQKNLKMLPQIYDAWERKEAGEGILVMEYVEGETLSSYLKKMGPLPERKILTFARLLAGFLQEIHGANPPILYRDLKPDNIMVQPDESLRLVDIGSGIQVGSGSVWQKYRIGSFGYASPEQWNGGLVDVRTDVYALGAVLSDLCRGKCEGAGAPLPGTGLGRIIERCLQEKPEHRYPTMQAFLRDLGRYERQKRFELTGLLLQCALRDSSLFLTATFFLWGINRYAWLTLVFYFLCKIYSVIRKKRLHSWRQEVSLWLYDD